MNKVHRFISLLLCLALILFCLSSPLQRSASAVIDPVYSTAYAVVSGVTVNGFKEGAKLISSALASVWGEVFSFDFLQTCVGVLELGNWTSFKDEYSAFSEGGKSAGTIVLSRALLTSIASAYKLKTGVTLSVPQQEVEIYIPPDTVWDEAELITYDRLMYRGFSDLTEVNENVLAGNKISWQMLKNLEGFELFMRTTFVDTLTGEFDSLSSDISSLSSKISTLTNTLTSKLGSIETSLDVMTSTLSDDISDLKTVTSSFGNAILSKLDKLDAINTSIQNISFADLSADFVDLRETIALYDSNILKAVTAIPDQVSDTLSSYFDTLSNDLHDISQKLGAETSYLQDLLLEFQSVRDVITNGFADVLVSLDSISVEVDVPIDLQSVIDQIFSSEASIVGVLDSVYSVLDNGFLGLEDALLGYFESVNDLFLNEYLDIFANGISDAVGSLSDILSNTENLVEVKVSLEELVGSNLLTSDIFLGSDLLTGSFFENIIGDFSLTVWNRIQDLLDHLTTAHSNLSSRIGSINSNLAGKITDFKDALIGDFADFKSWLSDILPGILVGVNGIAGNTIDLDDSLLDALSDAEAPLYESILSGFDQGGNFFGLTTNFLVGEYDAFLAAAKIINEFTDLSFFDKLIVASASIGLVGALLGMALNAVNYSATQRRREEAAQAKASSRMERSCAA